MPDPPPRERRPLPAAIPLLLVGIVACVGAAALLTGDCGHDGCWAPHGAEFAVALALFALAGAQALAVLAFAFAWLSSRR